jgi:DNA-directed RNA polymerase subunit RPC12/RpoP
MLESLVRLSYREAHNGFTIPGLCKIELVDREARVARHPQTGEMIEIPARKVLRIRPVQKAKEMVARVPVDPSEDAHPEGAAPVPDSQAEPVQEPILITFKCTACGTEIEASTDMAGVQSACPGCGSPIQVPTADAIHALAGLEQMPQEQPQAAEPEPPTAEEQAVPAKPVEAGEEQWQKGSTIRIELPKNMESYTQPVKRTVYIKRKN